MKKGQDLNSVRQKKNQIRSSFIRNIMEQALLTMFSFLVVLTNKFTVPLKYNLTQAAKRNN